jgi:hypothetical protein
MERGESSTGEFPTTEALKIGGDEFSMRPLMKKAVPYKRASSLTHRRLPLQEAIRNGNSKKLHVLQLSIVFISYFLSNFRPELLQCHSQD